MIKVYCDIYDTYGEILRIDTSKNASNAKLISFSLGLLDRGDTKDTISWGVYSNKGDLSFVLPKAYKEMFEDNVDFRVYRFAFFAEDTEISNSKTQLALFYANDFKYDRETKIVEVELTDRLQDWQNITVNINFPSMHPTNTSLYTIYEDVLKENNALPNIMFDVGVEDLLKTTLTTYKYRESNISFWEFINEICSLIGGRVFVNNSGIPILSLATTNNTVDIKSNFILSIEPICAKRHNSISSAKINVPRNVELEAISSKFDYEMGLMTANESGNTIEFSYTYGFSPITESSSNWAENYKIEIPENYANANILEQPTVIPSLTFPNNFSWGYRLKPITTNESSIASFHDKLQGSVSEITFSKDGDYITKLSWVVNTVALKKILSEQTQYQTISLSSFCDFQVYGYVVRDGGSEYVEKVFPNASNGKTITIDTSPWIYNDAYYSSGVITSKLFSRLESLSNGRTCLELSCVLGDHYYKDKLVIPKAKTIRNYDVVIPYVKRSGEQVPYMGTKDKPINFLVTGVEYLYNGHLVQKLHLQEYVED